MNSGSKTEMSGQLLFPRNCERKPLVAELFHALNQPLTTLRCSLELALIQPRTVEQTNGTLRQALAQAERLAWLASGLQELMASDDAGDDREMLELDVYVQQVVMDILPVAETAGVQISLHRSSGCCVVFEARRLRQALFHLMEYALSAVRAGTAIRVEIRQQDDEALLTLETTPGPDPRELPAADAERLDEGPGRAELARRLQLAIVRGIMAAAGGKFQLSSAGQALSFEIRLPQTSFLK